jgi:DNA anti-recombination protein RmuC
MSSVQEKRAAYVPVTPANGPDETPQPAAAETTAPDQGETGNIDKIREIIFGGHMRDYDKRFTRLEARLVKEGADLRDDTKRRFEVLEMFIKREFEALAERLQTEQRHREESTQNLSRALTETGQALEAKLVQFDESSARGQRDLRTQILDQSRSLSEEIRQKHAEMSTALEREVAELNHEKPSRSHLASMFTELAARLNGDLKTTTEI